MAGKLIVIDGADGSGKATQTNLLINRLKKEGYDILKLDFPRYGKESAFFVEQYLTGKYGKAEEVGPKLASLFYALDRYDSKKEIQQALNQGKIIVSNRYVSANAGHQGGKIANKKKREEFLEWLDELEHSITEIPRPDLNFYLHVPWQVGQTLVDKKGHREYVGGKKRDIHEDDGNHLKNAQESFSHLIEYKPNWKKIDCMKDDKLMAPEDIHKLLWEEVKKEL